MPLALTRHEGRTILVLTDPGGEPFDRILEREPLDLARVLSLAINLAAALGHAHRRGLIHKDVKPENILVDDAVMFGSPALASHPGCRAKFRRPCRPRSLRAPFEFGMLLAGYDV
jgi:serine/threonine protein kinase